MLSRMRRWWDEPDHFEWTTEFLTQRGLIRSAQVVMAIVAASAALVAFSFFAGLPWSKESMVAVGLFGAAFTVGMSAFWLTRWPTRRQSELAVSLGTVFIGVWSVAQPNSSVAVLACSATAVTGGYIAFFHNTKLLLFNFVVGIAAAISATWRLAVDTTIATAIGAFWLIFFLNLTVPLAIRGMSRAMGAYAKRSHADPLTGLLNRRGFADAVSRLLADVRDEEGHLGLLMVDLDDFKLVNDTHGHAAGDRALQAIADLLRECCPDGAAISRAGGEEFLVAVRTRRGGAESLATQLCRAIAALPHLVTASIGTSSVAVERLRRRDLESLLDEVIAAADDAMYAAKRNGGNQVHFG